MRLKRLLSTALLIGFVLAVAVRAQATVTEVNRWNFGDDDPSASFGSTGNATTVDANSVQDLTKSGGCCTYIDNGVGGFAIDFNSGYYFDSTSSFTQNGSVGYGIEAVVRPDAITASLERAIHTHPNPENTGQPSINVSSIASHPGWSLFLDNVGFGSGTSVPAVAGTWYNIALTHDSNTSRMYINGTLAMTGASANNPITTLQFGRNASNLSIDRARRFTYTVGSFSTSDLILGSSPAGSSVIPEPSTFALGILGLLWLGLFAWRRRRRAI